MKLSDYQLKHFASHFLCVGDIGASKASKSFRVNPNNEGNTMKLMGISMSMEQMKNILLQVIIAPQNLG